MIILGPVGCRSPCPGERPGVVSVLDQRGRGFAQLFSDDKDRPIRRTWFHQQLWTPAVVSSGLPKGTTSHELRHMYASLLIAGEESVKVVQTRLGHATADETLNTYDHLWPDSEDPVPSRRRRRPRLHHRRIHGNRRRSRAALRRRRDLDWPLRAPS